MPIVIGKRVNFCQQNLPPRQFKFTPKGKIYPRLGTPDLREFLKHYLHYHLSDLNRNNVFLLSYAVIFLQPEAALLDFYEDFWWLEIKPSINIQRKITPITR